MTQGNARQLYVFNAPVLTAYGDWRFEGPLSVADAKRLLAAEFVSAVGHAGAARFLSELLGLEVPANRISVKMQPGDRALVLRLESRLPEGAVLSAEQMRAIPFELGLLTRLSEPGQVGPPGNPILKREPR